MFALCCSHSTNLISSSIATTSPKPNNHQDFIVQPKSRQIGIARLQRNIPEKTQRAEAEARRWRKRKCKVGEVASRADTAGGEIRNRRSEEEAEELKLKLAGGEIGNRRSEEEAVGKIGKMLEKKMRRILLWCGCRSGPCGCGSGPGRSAVGSDLVL
ncbi:hypothetical protein LXL04_001788 [Taraxacum kok-saghyz]